MKQASILNLFWLYLKLAVLLIVVTSIVAGILTSVDLTGLRLFNSIFHIL
jgi:hypothetical protein